MQRDADGVISKNERVFIEQALKAECRLDGRGLYDFRQAKIEFSLDDQSATLTLGSTRVMAVIDAKLEAPYPERPNEGSIRFNVECGPMASPAFEPGRPGAEAMQLARLVERALKQSGALDVEALCVVAGRKVWALRCDVHVLDHGGNLTDACILAALAAFMVHRRCEVTVGGESGTEIIVHPKEQREPLPLTIHHHPISVTWALFEDGELVAVDPDLREQAAQAGSATFVVNTNKEVCAVHKADGIGLTQLQIMRLIRLSCKLAEALVAMLRTALQAHEVARVAARVRRAQGMPGLPAQSRHITVSVSDAAPSTARPARTQLPDLARLMEANSNSSEEAEDAQMTEPAAAQPASLPLGKSPNAGGRGKGTTADVKPDAQMTAPSPQQQEQLPAVDQQAKAKAAKRSLEDPSLRTIAAMIAGTTAVKDLSEAVKRPQAKKKSKK